MDVHDANEETFNDSAPPDYEIYEPDDNWREADDIWKIQEEVIAAFFFLFCF